MHAAMMMCTGAMHSISPKVAAELTTGTGHRWLWTQVAVDDACVCRAGALRQGLDICSHCCDSLHSWSKPHERTR